MGELIKITELTKSLGLSSRTLRYYEQVGLIRSIRPEHEAYRYYDGEAVGRLHQIMILRKMQIPIKDIIRIYEKDDISDTVDVFCRKIEDINSEVTALSELKDLINAFLKRMVESGIKTISAMPLLYEEMEKQLELMEEQESLQYTELESISQRLEKPADTAIISLSGMRVISSYLRDSPGTTDAAGFRRFIQSEDIAPGRPGSHEMFELQTSSGEAIILRIPDDYQNTGCYADYVFPGGLYAAANAYADEDLGQILKSLVHGFDNNRLYQIDYGSNGELRHPVMLEELISPDEKRELICIYVPLKKRIANTELYDDPEEIPAGSVSVGEIEAQNPVLWRKDVPLDTITPVNGPYYRVLESGDAEYVGWISTRVLRTNVRVRLPYRVDIEFALTGGGGFDYGTSEGDITIYRGSDGVYMSDYSEHFGVNTGNMASDSDAQDSPGKKRAIEFRQPVFLDRFEFPGRGRVRTEGYNRLTWIIGEKQLAVIINGEVRYCGVNFPYMSLDLSGDECADVWIGSNGQRMKYIRSVSVSQLEYRRKNTINKKELLMITRQSNNTIPIIHRLITNEYGENFWFNGCARYVMECLGEKDYNYIFFAGITGDEFAQFYPKQGYMGDSLSEYMISCGSDSFLRDAGDSFELGTGGSSHAERTFEKCGYSCTFVTNRMLRKNTDMYLSALISYIDRGIPVIYYGLGESFPIGVFVGYEEYGKRLLYLTNNDDKPQSIALEKALEVPEPHWSDKFGWIFVGEKKVSRPLADIYREAIFDLPKLLSTETDRFYLGAKAFRAWADDVESGKYDRISPEEFDPWFHYTTYICAMATIGTGCHEFLDKARALNPDMTFLEDVSRLYRQYERIWHNDNGKDLEAVGGGFNVTLGALQDRDRRAEIAAKLRKCADVTDEIVRALESGIKALKA